MSPAAEPGKGNPGQRFGPILPPSALPAGETMQAQREPGRAGAETGRGFGADPGAVPGTGSAEFPREFGSAADPALFRRAAGRR